MQEPGQARRTRKGNGAPMIKVTMKFFSGTSKVFDGTLAALIRGLAVDNALNHLRARIAAEAFDPADLAFTDNSTGVAGTAVADLPIPAAPHTASGSTGAQLTGLNAALAVLSNGIAVVAANANLLRAEVGLPAIVYAGTVATPGTIPAQTKTVAGAQGTAAADFGAGFAALTAAKDRVRSLVAALDETLAAVGAGPIASGLSGSYAGGDLLAIPAATAAAAGGVNALSKAEADAFLTAAANAVATIADLWSDALAGFEDRPLSVVAA